MEIVLKSDNQKKIDLLKQLAKELGVEVNSISKEALLVRLEKDFEEGFKEIKEGKGKTIDNFIDELG